MYVFSFCVHSFVYSLYFMCVYVCVPECMCAHCVELIEARGGCQSLWNWNWSYRPLGTSNVSSGILTQVLCEDNTEPSRQPREEKLHCYFADEIKLFSWKNSSKMNIGFWGSLFVFETGSHYILPVF